MQNPFYTAFDTETLEPRSQLEGDRRTPFQVDRDRVLFSYAFRRLQSKTQVFQSGEHDFYRTRLTHTLEVARIARSIAEALAAQPEIGIHPDPDLVEAIGYAHDLGHPPFGHIGERKLNELMAPYGGFEGNAQTLRILTELIFDTSDGPRGMKPTRAFLDGVLKYKALHREFSPGDKEGVPPDNHFLYNEQECHRQWAFHGIDTDALPSTTKGWNSLKSIECQIMDWADDTAYSLHDIVDGTRAGFLTQARIRDWLKALDEPLAQEFAPPVAELLEWMTEGKLDREIARCIGRYIQGCNLEEVEAPVAGTGNRYRFRLQVAAPVRTQCQCFKRIAVDLIFRSPAIQQVEYRGGLALDQLFGALREHYIEPVSRPLDILPEPLNKQVRKASDTIARARLVCDYISGLTDGQAIRLHQRLFHPGGDSLGLLG